MSQTVKFQLGRSPSFFETSPTILTANKMADPGYPMWVRQPQRRGRQPINWQNIFWKLHENDRICTETWASLAPHWIHHWSIKERFRHHLSSDRATDRHHFGRVNENELHQTLLGRTARRRSTLGSVRMVSYKKRKPLHSTYPWSGFLCPTSYRKPLTQGEQWK